MEHGYGEVPSWAVREGGRERTRSFKEVGKDMLQEEREKNVLFNGPGKN